MRVSSNFLLAVIAYTAQFLGTESYVTKLLRPSRVAESSRTTFTQLASANKRGKFLAERSSIDRNLQQFCSNLNDQHIDKPESSWSQRLIRKCLRPLTALLTGLVFFLAGARSSAARPSSSSASRKTSSVKQNRSERQTRKTDKIVEVEIVVNKKTGTNQQLSRLGFVLVGVTTVASLMSGDDTKKKKTVVKQAKKAPSTPKITWEDDEEEEEEIIAPRRPIKVVDDVKPPKKRSITIPKRVRKGLDARNFLPAEEDLFSDSQEADRFFEVKINDAEEKVTMNNTDDEEEEEPAREEIEIVRKVNKFSLPPSKAKVAKAVQEIDEEEFVPLAEDEDIDIPELPPTPSAPAPPAKKSIFDRIFQKRSTSRPTDLGELMRVEDASSTFRAATATVLTAYLPESLGLFTDVQPGGIMSHSVDRETLYSGDEKRISILVTLKDEVGLESKQAADAFADVTNAMLVTLTDKCVDSLDKKGKSAEEILSLTTAALDTLTDFAISAASLFGQVLPGVIIEDGGIKYNGKAQRGKLETLFFNSMKGGMDMSAFAGLVNEGEEVGDKEEADLEAAASLEQKRTGRLQCLQHIFSISEGKRGSLEQKAMKDMIMGMMGGEGGAGMGDLAGMLGNMGGMPGMPGGGMGGNGKGMPDMDDAAFEEMMKQARQEAGDADGAMDASEMANVLNESLGQMRQQLKDGQVTKENVKELEQSMNMGLKEMISMIEMARKVAGKKMPELEDMLSLFKQLLAVKNK